MRRPHLALVCATLFVVVGTVLMYAWLRYTLSFWNAQAFWSIALLLGWGIVSIGYYRQGWIVRKARSATHVSLLLPSVVFLVQCILFVKGIYYHDYALIVGAVLVNSGVVFDLYQISINRG